MYKYIFVLFGFVWFGVWEPGFRVYHAAVQLRSYEFMTDGYEGGMDMGDTGGLFILVSRFGAEHSPCFVLLFSFLFLSLQDMSSRYICNTV